MSNKRIIIYVILFITFLVLLRIPWIISSANGGEVEARQGVINLKSWSFEETEITALNGEWEFYPGELLDPEDLEAVSDSQTAKFIQVPGSWDSFFSEETERKAGTYRLLIQLPEEQPDRLYKIQFPRTLVATKVFVNGQLLIDHAGSKFEKNQQDPQLITRSASFRKDGDKEIEVIIQFEGNNLAREHGIGKTIRFGDSEALSSYQNQNMAKQLLVVIISMLSAVYTFAFFVIRRDLPQFLYFSLATLCLSIATLLDDDKILLSILPLDYTWTMKILFLSYLGVAAFLLLFVKNLYFIYQKNRLIRTLSWLHFISGVIILIVPLSYLLKVSGMVFLLIALTFLIMAFLMWPIIKKGNKENIFLLLAGISGAFSYIGGMYSSATTVELPYYATDIVIAFFALSIFLSLLYFRTRTENQDLTDKLQEELERKNRFLSNTAHELKNPLHSLMNIAHSVLQKEDAGLSDSAKNNLGLMVSISRHMSLTLNDLLDVARLNDHMIKLQKKSINIGKLVSGVVDILDLTIEHKKLAVDIQIPADFPNVAADENRLLQILFNLLHNAVKFTEEGTITIRARAERNLAVIEVEDTGAGMDAETLNRIFEPYAQGENSSGLGLGLSISRQLAELHGGKLTAFSVPDKGSTFTFTLRLAENTIEEKGAGDALPENDGNAFRASMDPVYEKMADVHEPAILSERPRILVVDDDPINLKVLANILSEDQYEVQGVTSAEEAFKLIGQAEWDVVVTDVMMPRVSGYGLTRMIREKFSFLELPVLHLTARDQPEDIYTGFLAGANDYVSKPVESLELKVRVNALADLKRSINERLRVEGAWLQAQIKPHFLFNTLNTIASLSEIDADRMAGLLEQFGNYLRRSFTPDNLDRVIRLEQELDLVRSYLYIEQERFGSRLQIEWDISETAAVHVPPLSIQTLVENALQHGILKRPQGGKVKIRIRRMEIGTEIAIIDDGVGMAAEKVKAILRPSAASGSGIGIINTDLRLKQLYGAGLMIDSTPDKGTSVSFCVRSI